MQNKYIINKEYSFPDNDGIETTILIQLTEDEVIEYAVHFIENEEEYEVDGAIKDLLDEANAQSIAENLFQQWKDGIESVTDDDDIEEIEASPKSLEDFYDDAWEYLGDSVLYYCWCDDFKKDCIGYYRNRS